MAGKTITFIGIALVVLFAALATGYLLTRNDAIPGNSPQSSTEESQPAAPKTVYRCPMDGYTSDKPGECPLCGMNLETVTIEVPANGAGTTEEHAPVTLTAGARQLIGVQTEPAKRQLVILDIRAYGMVDYDERGLSIVSLKFGGWVEELFVKSAGDRVEKGAPLLRIYSPELLEAQRNYIIALEDLREDAPLSQEILTAARERLALWDFSVEQIAELEENREPRTHLTINAPEGGAVIERNVSQGQRIEPGQMLYRLADLDKVWVLGEVYEYELSLIKVGQEARITMSALPGSVISAPLDYIYPYLDEKTRTVRVRLELPNLDGRFKPGQYANLTIPADLGEQLAVRKSAILDTGARQIVFVALGEGRFEPREVEVSQRTGELAVISSGLREGEEVVVSGNFLIDSESRRTAALERRFATTAAGAGAPDAAMPNMGHQQH